MIIMAVFVFFEDKILKAETKEIIDIPNGAVVKKENIEEFLLEGQKVILEKEIFDFSNNKFLLYELSPKCYAIYSVKGEARVFLEGSYDGNSPYYAFTGNDIHYLGIGNYYYINDGKYINIMTGQALNKTEVPQSYEIDYNAYYDFENNIELYAEKFPSTPDSNKTVNEDGFVKIKNHEYFEELWRFPDNRIGTCGLVSVCILLGYLDEMVDDRFIPDNAKYNNGEFKWFNGTSNYMHQYLFDNCLHTIAGIKADNGYPMAVSEIKATIKDYLNNI